MRLHPHTLSPLIRAILALAMLNQWAVPTSSNFDLVVEPEPGNARSDGEDGKERPAAQGSGRVTGYASASSVPQGGDIRFHTSATAGVQTYDLAILRLGVSSFQQMLRINNLPAGTYSCGPVGVPAGQENVQLGCNWPVAYTLTVPLNWPSGLYYANLLAEGDYAGDYGAFIPFIVTEDDPGSTSNIVFLYPTFTLHAYSEYGGWGFYTQPAARRITLDRPIIERCDPYMLNCSDDWSVPMVRWLASEAMTVEYIASEDLHRNPQLLQDYRLLLIVGHDEYWSAEMRDGLDAFVNGGGNVAVFSGNTLYRQVRYSESNGRVLVCYKGDYEDDPLYGIDNRRVATEFDRAPIPNWPENSSIGVAFRNGHYINVSATQPAGFTVYRTGHWVFEGTGLAEGDRFIYEQEKRMEVDGALHVWQGGLPVVTGADQTPLNFTILGIERSTAGYGTMGFFTRPGGGTVFNAATIGWARGLWPQQNPSGYQTIRRITRNVINRLANGPLAPEPVLDVVMKYDPSDLITDEAVTFTAQPIPNYAATPITYTWDFGDGTAVTVTNTVSFTHTFAAVGTYTVSLTATNGYGEAAVNQSVNIVPPPVAVEGITFTHAPEQPNTGDSITFVAEVFPESPTGPVTYTWDFGDGTVITTNVLTTTHTYTTSGSYTITLIADNQHGQAVATKDIIVTARLFLPLIRR